jgi:hypothetical protein
MWTGHVSWQIGVSRSMFGRASWYGVLGQSIAVRSVSPSLNRSYGLMGQTRTQAPQ